MKTAVMISLLDVFKMFSTELKAVLFFEKMRWNAGTFAGIVAKLKLWKCVNVVAK